MKQSNEKAWNALRELTDPELPFLTLEDLGVIRAIKIKNQNHVITISPTYIGCPAISVIESKIKTRLKKIGKSLEKRDEKWIQMNYYLY